MNYLALREADLIGFWEEFGEKADFFWPDFGVKFPLSAPARISTEIPFRPISARAW